MKTGSTVYDLSWTKDVKQAPFSIKMGENVWGPPRGSLLSYPVGEFEVRDVREPFIAKLTVFGTDKGYRSAFRLLWRDESGAEFPMFAKSFEEMVAEFKHGELRGFPTISGKWLVVKRGANYSIKLLEVIK